MHFNYGFPRAISAYGLLSAALTACTFGYTYSKLGIKIESIKIGAKPEQVGTNFSWFQSLSVIFDSVVAIVLVIYELLLVFSPIKFKWYSYIFVRSITYFYLGFLVLGVAGDLGIGSCPFALLAGLINLVCGILIWCKLLIIDDVKSPEPSENSEKKKEKEKAEKEKSDKKKNKKNKGSGAENNVDESDNNEIVVPDGEV